MAPDADEDGLADREPSATTFRLDQRGQPCPIRITGRTTHVVTFGLLKAGTPPRAAADLSLGEGDVEYNDDKGYLTVRVHNTGTAAAGDFAVVLYEGTPEIGRPVGRATVSHLDWPASLTPQTVKVGWRYEPASAEAKFTAVVDPEGAVAEITRSNNRVTRTVRFSDVAGQPQPE